MILSAAVLAPTVSGCVRSKQSFAPTPAKFAPTPAEIGQTPAELAAGILPIDLTAAPGAWRRYGADPTGHVDSTLAIEAASSVSVTSFDDVGGTYRVSGPIQVNDHCTVAGRSGVTELIVVNADNSVFVAYGASDLTIQGIRFRVVRPSASPYTAAVLFADCSGCICRDCEFIGSSWAGVWLDNSNHCTVTHCYFHDFQGSVQDSADICVYADSSHNLITENRCFGGNQDGVLVEDPHAQSFPSDNLIVDNEIGGHTAYGVCIYLPDQGDTYNVVRNNRIRDIRGVAFGGASGPGIYVAGAGAGGTVIEGNTLTRCCLETRVREESPAAIGLHGMSAANAPIEIFNNVVHGMPEYDGILVAVSTALVRIWGNNVTLAPGNSAGTPIRVQAASHVVVQNNVATRATTRGRCIYIYANGAAVGDIAVLSNTCSGGDYNQIDFDGAGGGHLHNITCSGNRCTDGGTGASASCISISATTSGLVAGNQCSSAKAAALCMRDARMLDVRGNTFDSGGETSVFAAGDCDGSVYSGDNVQNAAIVDLSVGLVIEHPA